MKTVTGGDCKSQFDLVSFGVISSINVPTNLSPHLTEKYYQHSEIRHLCCSVVTAQDECILSWYDLNAAQFLCSSSVFGKEA